MYKRKKRALFFYRNSVLYEREASVMSRAQRLKTEENVSAFCVSKIPFTFYAGDFS